MRRSEYKMLVGVGLPSRSSRRIPSGKWNGVQTVRPQAFAQRCDSRLVRNRRIGIRAARRRFEWILATMAVNGEQCLGFRVECLEVAIA